MRTLALTLAVLLSSLSSPASAQNSPAAERVFERARAATGGRAWNGLRSIHESGVEDGRRIQQWADPLRYGLRRETEVGDGKLVQGYNGVAEWRILPSGAQTGSIEKAVVARLRADAFFAAWAFYFPSRFDLRSTHLGVRKDRGRDFDVVRVQPAGGQPRELWFDRKTGLLSLMTIEDAAGRTTVEASDYRKVGPVKLPFRWVTSAPGQARTVERRIEKADFVPLDRALFSLPRTGK